MLRVLPPSTLIAAPEIMPARTEARNTTTLAMSSGITTRPSGTSLNRCFSASASETPRSRAVRPINVDGEHDVRLLEGRRDLGKGDIRVGDADQVDVADQDHFVFHALISTISRPALGLLIIEHRMIKCSASCRHRH